MQGVSGKSDPFQSTGNRLYDDVLMLVKNNRQSTLDGFLQNLATNSELRENLTTKTLFYKSRSRHGSTAENPRALVMYGNADLVLTFNGAPDEALFDGLEIMGFNRVKGVFEFRDVIFKQERAEQPNTYANEVQFENDLLRVREPNSSLCIGCHGKETVKPQWGTYLAWVGSFGSYEESFYLAKARYATDPTGFELNKLTAFDRSGSQTPRYRNFYWGEPTGLNISSTLFGILINYRMAYAALGQGLSYLQKTEVNKYKYAYAGYLLSCPQSFLPNGADGPGDGVEALRPLMNSMMTERVKFEVGRRLMIQTDLASLGAELSWRAYGIPSLPFSLRLNRSELPSGLMQNASAAVGVVGALTTRPESIYKLARFENLYSLMGLNPEGLYLQASKTSWDGYNEIQDFMSDYLLRYYGLPPVTASNKRQAETMGPRPDLDAPLKEEDYAGMQSRISALGLPQMSQGSKQALCAELASQSQASLAK